jgi:hypothetical protein
MRQPRAGEAQAHAVAGGGERPRLAVKAGEGGGGEVVGLGAGDHADRATRVLQGRGLQGVLRAAGEGRAGQPVARRQGPPADAAQPGAGVGGAAAEHGRGEEPPATAR